MMTALLEMMDVNDMRVILAVVNFAIFVGILYWVYGKTNPQKNKEFQDAANLPFRNEDTQKR